MSTRRLVPSWQTASTTSQLRLLVRRRRDVATSAGRGRSTGAPTSAGESGVVARADVRRYPVCTARAVRKVPVRVQSANPVPPTSGGGSAPGWAPKTLGRERRAAARQSPATTTTVADQRRVPAVDDRVAVPGRPATKSAVVTVEPSSSGCSRRTTGLSETGTP